MSAENYLREKYGAYRGHFAWRELEEAFTTGHLRARTEQATEIAELKAKLSEVQGRLPLQVALAANNEQRVIIAELKAKLAEVMPLAKFACDVLRDEDHPDNLAHDYDFLTFGGNEYVLKATIEATIERILKD
jgi:hypothetical protein